MTLSMETSRKGDPVSIELEEFKDCNEKGLLVSSKNHFLNRKGWNFFFLTCILLSVAILLISFFGKLYFCSSVTFIQPAALPISRPDYCTFTLLESIPENLTYPSSAQSSLSTYQGWKELINMANETLDIASFYWTLLGEDVVPDPSDIQGEDIFYSLLNAGTKRGIKIRIAQSQPTTSQPDKNTEKLQEEGAAQVRSLDFYRLLGGGVLHTKMWIVDSLHIYIGSANMDWRALTQIKELGAKITNCPTLAHDMKKIFEVYWYLGNPNSVIPSNWPSDLSTQFNQLNPLTAMMNGTLTSVYTSSSPPSFCPEGRTSDLNSIIQVIVEAKSIISIAVMDYFPTSLYSKNTTFWPVIDNLLRQAAIERGVHIRLLAGYWDNTRPIMLNFLKSLQSLNSSSYIIETKLFVVPRLEPQKKIPYSRVAHNKYMVTDQHVYIGTSNWSEDYFIDTAGSGLIIKQSLHNDSIENEPIRKQLQSVFDRDWFSEYAKPIDEFV